MTRCSSAKLSLCLLTLMYVTGCGALFSPSVFLAAPDGKKILLAEYEKEGAQLRRLEVLQLDSKPRRRVLRAPRGETLSLVWSPDGRTIACFVTAEHASSVALIDVKSGRTKLAGCATALLAGSLAWSPDSTRIACMLQADPEHPRVGNQVLVVNVIDSAVSRLLPAGAASGSYGPGLEAIAWSPDGKSLLFPVGRQGDAVLHIMGIASNSRYSPLSGTRKVDLVDAPRSGPTVVLRQLNDPLRHTTEGSISAYNVHSCSRFTVSDHMGTIAFSPDSSRVAYDKPTSDTNHEGGRDVWVTSLQTKTVPKLIIRNCGGLIPGGWGPQNKIFVLSSNRRSIRSVTLDDGSQRQELVW